jgi:hypothetical protein
VHFYNRCLYSHRDGESSAIPAAHDPGYAFVRQSSGAASSTQGSTVRAPSVAPRGASPHSPNRRGDHHHGFSSSPGPHASAFAVPRLQSTRGLLRQAEAIGRREPDAAEVEREVERRLRAALSGAESAAAFAPPAHAPPTSAQYDPAAAEYDEGPGSGGGGGGGGGGGNSGSNPTWVFDYGRLPDVMSGPAPVPEPPAVRAVGKQLDERWVRERSVRPDVFDGLGIDTDEMIADWEPVNINVRPATRRVGPVPVTGVSVGDMRGWERDNGAGRGPFALTPCRPNDSFGRGAFPATHTTPARVAQRW